jgi:hypothetical protein
MRSIFEKYNARWLQPSDVAQTFVPPPQFAEIASPRHGVILGPRGSGKTTLLKMLTREGLHLWRHPDADATRARVTFTGVFIGSDRAWEGQLGSVGGRALDQQSRSVFAAAAFTTHVLRALVDAASYRFYVETEKSGRAMEASYEADVVSSIGQTWSLTLAIRSMLGLKRSLSDRLVQIGQLASQTAAMAHDNDRSRLLANPILHVPYLPAVLFGIDILDDALAKVGCTRRPWGLLFDELEIAPPWLRRDLFRQLRSTDNRLIFKLALSPYNRDLEMEVDPTAPRPGNDYDEISLWYTHRVGAYNFSRALWEQLAASRGVNPSPEKVLGRSYFETPDVEWIGKRTAYRNDSEIGKRLVLLAANDISFRKFLEANNIDVASLDTVPVVRRAAILRKTFPIAAFRYEFRRRSRNTELEARQQKIRTIKKPPEKIYSGAGAIFAMLEGNPRWFIGVVNRLLERARPGRRLEGTVEIDVIWKATHRFRALLKSLPTGTDEQRGINLLRLIDVVGAFFRNAVLGDNFDPDPPGSFTVPSNADEQLMRVLEVGLDAGALLLIPDADSAITTSSLKGKRMRLSYLLAPHFWLPLRLGRDIPLTTIIRQAPSRQIALLQ